MTRSQVKRRMDAQPVGGFSIRVNDQYLIFHPSREVYQLARIGGTPANDQFGTAGEILQRLFGGRDA